VKLDRLLFAAFLIFIIGAAPAVMAQDSVTETVTVAVPATVDPGPEDALHRGTPRGSIDGFLEACSIFDAICRKRSAKLAEKSWPGS